MSTDRSYIYLSPPHMGRDERDLLIEAFDSNWIAPVGPNLDAFEAEIAAAVQTRTAVAVSSGTAALHLALLMLGIGPGDTVLLPSLTFAATANAVTYVGARPRFVDSSPDTWTIDPVLVADELAASARRGHLPGAVIAVDIYGQCADYHQLDEACGSAGVPIMEDAAEALGSTYRGRPAGTFGVMSALSFNGNKIITASAGGALATDRVELGERARYLATQARDPVPHYEHREVGFNYRLSNLLAAVGRGQLRVLPDRVGARRANNRFYRAALADVPGVRFMPLAPYGESNCWLTCVLVEPREFGASAADVRRHLETQGVESRPTWKPMHLQPVFRDCAMVGGRVAEAIFDHGLCLPSGSNLTEAERERIVTAFLETPRRTTSSRTR
jgi:dTDP-4-amino-4,6-dideoxygalactose transaminase